MIQVRIDLELGNDEAVNGWPKYKSKEAGIATSVYASFDPDLAGKHSSVSILDLSYVLIRICKTTLERISQIARLQILMCILLDLGHLAK